MQRPLPDVNEKWIHAQRQRSKTTSSWACILCIDRKIFQTTQDIWSHAQAQHADKLPHDQEALETFRKKFTSESALKRPIDDFLRKSNPNETNRANPDPGGHKRSLSGSGAVPPPRSLSGLGVASLNLGPGTPKGSNVDVHEVCGDEEQATPEGPRKRAAIGDGISAGSGSPYRESSASPPPRRSKARQSATAQHGSNSDLDNRNTDMFDIQRPQPGNKQLWREQDGTTARPSFIDPKNVASIQAHKQRAQALQPKPRKSFQSPQAQNNASLRSPIGVNTTTPAILKNPGAISSQTSQALVTEEIYDIILQPETRPISQEQLVAEVKGIYAGLVMVEAKCIEVDNKQATLAQADPSGQPKLNPEQWQALIALHRTLLHEHHDFFLASQHPSASPALRRLASKYAMPARMWRHGIHSFLELLRHRLPSSLDHMLAFIYLAYSMMALLFETVPAFEDTWIECLGDLGRYRMAIEDDDIRDREVWTGVARNWYSKASDKAPTTGRLYHHLAILARPNALQQLFYYAKSLCVVIPFASARESILTLFEPVLNTENTQNQYRLPPFDTAFIKAHGLLFTNKNMGKFDSVVDEFLSLLDNHIGRVTRKFMEQGTHIAISNAVALLGFGSKDNILMKIITASRDGDVPMGEADEKTDAMVFFKHAQRLSNSTFNIVLQRIGDPNVLPFIHVVLVFLNHMSHHSSAIGLLTLDFPFKPLVAQLNTLLASIGTLSRLDSEKFPEPEKDENRPFPEDFAMRGLLFAEKYFPETWFTNEKIDEEEKYHERASMTAQRKERILWLACKIAKQGSWMTYNGHEFSVGPRADLDLTKD